MEIGKETVFHVPSGCIDFRRHFERYIAKSFGGFTYQESIGGWIDGDGVLIVESMARYIVAMPEATNRHEIIKIAQWIKRACKEDCVYVRFPCGTVATI